MAKSIKKILVVALDNLGDAVMGTCLFRALRDAYPDAQIGYWTKAYARGLFDDYASLHRVHACDPFWDDAPGRPKGSFVDFWASVQEIKNEKYDVALILNTEWRRALACWWAGIPVRVGFNRRKSWFFLTRPVSPHAVDALSLGHIVDDNRRLLEGWMQKEIPIVDAMPHLEVSVKEKDRLRSWLEKAGWQKKTLLVFHPFAGRAIRCWPLSHWEELAGDLAKERSDLRFIWVCGPNEGVGLSAIQSSWSDSKSQIFADAPLGEVKAIISHARVFVGGDSGPSHMAAALEVPVVALFGPSRPERSRPRGSQPITVLQRNPLSDLSVAEVKKAVFDLLSLK